MKGGPTSTIRSSPDPGKTAGDLAKERNKLEVSRRIDQVPPAQKSNEKNSKNRFTTNIVDASSDIFWKGFLWLLVVAQSILEDELYDALADLGSFQNIGESESTAWFAKIPNPCNAIPLSVKSQKIPNARGRKKLSNYLRWKIWKWKSGLISNCNPSPCDFQKRTRFPFSKESANWSTRLLVLAI